MTDRRMSHIYAPNGPDLVSGTMLAKQLVRLAGARPPA
ncbi:hypothetical protein GMJLKIPL_6425 [Methylobacterium isbiliense]|uniref:Uncharacterized protein n=1 Tax=Methylobacterium isbiliense TaxID=315478 RepID=A0ABQ4SS17_9HYPH|nr:hypothetical protein GMJLKIPL_6425 [Methylobacterium isbiliense]